MTEHDKLPLSQALPIAIVAVAPVVPIPGAIPADLSRPVVGPDHAAIAVPVAIIVRISVVGRRVIEAPMEVMPVDEVRPVIRVAISVTITAAAKDGRRTKTATPEGGCAAKAAAVEPGAAASEAATVKSTTSETSAATTAAKATATMATATVPDFRRQPVGCVFRRRCRAGTCKRDGLSALL